jgi:acetyl esterase/lipase
MFIAPAVENEPSDEEGIDMPGTVFFRVAILLLGIVSTLAFSQTTSAAYNTPAQLLNGDVEIGTLLSIPAAKAVLQKFVPELTMPAMGKAQSLSLRSLSRYAPQLVSDTMLQRIEAELAKLPPVSSLPRPAGILDFSASFQFETIRLWNDAAPGARGDKPDDIPTLTVVRPDRAAPDAAAVIIAPGGGYMILSAVAEGRLVADWFATRGITAFVLNYRLARNGYLHPTQLQDSQRAVRYVRANAATFGIDPKKIGMLGFSAGGHLTAMTETLFDAGKPDAIDPIERVGSRPDFAVLIYPGILQDRAGWKVSSITGSNPDAKTLQQTSPVLNVSGQTPPTFIVHATGDTLIPATDSTAFYNALRAVGVASELHIFDGGGHAFGMGAAAGPISVWPQLLDAWLRGRGLIVEPSIIKRN